MPHSLDVSMYSMYAELDLVDIIIRWYIELKSIFHFSRMRSI